MGCISSKNVYDPSAAPVAATSPFNNDFNEKQNIQTPTAIATPLLPTSNPVHVNHNTVKKKGGGYPGRNRPIAAPYTPNASEFESAKTTEITKKFVTVGGGNALKLVEETTTTIDSTPVPDLHHIEVIVPEGAKPGQELNVLSPDGTMINCRIPDGVIPGSRFIVEFPTSPPIVEAIPAPPY